MSDQPKLSIEAGKADYRGARVVIARHGDKSIRDKFDPDSEYHRRKFRGRVIEHFGLEDDAHEHIEKELLRAGDAFDAESYWQAALRTASEIQSQDTEWLWPGYLPSRELIILDGDPGLGKSQLTIDIAARVSRGDCMPPNDAPDGQYKPRSVLVTNAEDDAARTIKPRLDAAGADCRRVFCWSSMTGDDGDDERLLVLPDDLPVIEQTIVANDVALWIVDPLFAFLRQGLSMNSDQDVRQCLSAVKSMAERTGCTVLLVRHLNKKSGASALYRGGGSIGIVGAARSAFVVGLDPDDSDSRIFAATKSNLGPMPSSLRFYIETVERTSRVKWEGECNVSAGDLVASQGGRGEGSKLEQAKEIIREILSNGPRGQNEIVQAAKAAGISEKTCRRAKTDLGVQSEKTGFGEGEQWIWHPPSQNGQHI